MRRLLAALLLASAARAVEAPPGFAVETLATGLNAATAFALAPDGRIFIADQTGPLRIWKDGVLLPAPALDLSERLDTYWERGLVGLALHPDFPRTPHVFLLYVAKAPHTHHVLSRFTLTGDTIDPASEKILLTGEDQKKFPGPQIGGHQGGPLRFGPDGKLYVSLGEQTAGKLAQSLAHLQGKILRLNADGTVPADNPFLAETTGHTRAIWALGLRNTFGLAFEPGTGRLFSTDVGQTGWEEVNVIARGANYGWPDAEGFSTNPAFANPIHAYPPAIGRSIVGAAFAPRGAAAKFALPPAWRGKFFFADWAANWIKALDPENPSDVVTFARGLSGPVALEFAPDGSLLVLNRSTIWRDGKRWAANSGSLLRLRHTGETSATPAAAAHAPVLSSTGIMAKRNPFTVTDGLVEFTVIAPPWLPGVTVRRWISVPVGARLRVNAEGEFEFPRGTVVVQHHAVAKTAAPLETHVFTFDGAASHSRLARAAAYRWSDPAEDAKLVPETALAPLPGDEARRWLSPAAERELALDLSVAGFLLPLSPRQLDEKQRVLFATRGWLAPDAMPAAAPRVAALDDAAASLELRVRSYLDANCAACHRPGGPGRGAFDARFLTPLTVQNLPAAALVAGDLGIAGARLVVPGDPARSVLLLRTARTDALRMPAIALSDEPAPVLPALEAWIRSLAP
jgi:glucose/arabinose dehydrogenase